MVIGFIHELFTNLISPDSTSPEASLCNFHSIGAHRLFKPNEIWIIRYLIKSVRDLIAKYDGWDTALIIIKLYVIDGVKKGWGLLMELLEPPRQVP